MPKNVVLKSRAAVGIPHVWAESVIHQHIVVDPAIVPFAKLNAARKAKVVGPRAFALTRTLAEGRSPSDPSDRGGLNHKL